MNGLFQNNDARNFTNFIGSQTTAAGSLGQYMSKMNKSPAKWITESTWKECLQLSASILAFSGLCSNIAVNGAFWSKFSASENPFKFIENEGELENDKTTSTEGLWSYVTYITLLSLFISLHFMSRNFMSRKLRSSRITDG